MNLPLARRQLLSCLAPALLLCSPLQAAVHVTIVQGLGGMPEYEERFDSQRQQIENASQGLAGAEQVTSFHGEAAQREAILAHLQQLSEGMSEDDRLILYLVGHGSYDGETYRFNIPGPDLSSEDLLELADSLPGRHHVLVNTSSTSGALLEPLADQDRLLLVTATRSGNERNATEFGTFFARALGSEEADTNKNAQISLQEAFDYSQRAVTDFYESAGKLATEHPQLQGDEAGRVTLARLDSRRAPEKEDDNEALRALRAELDEVNSSIDRLQLRRSEMATEDYNRELRALLLQAALLNDEIDALEDEAGDAAPAQDTTD